MLTLFSKDYFYLYRFRESLYVYGGKKWASDFFELKLQSIMYALGNEFQYSAKPENNLNYQATSPVLVVPFGGKERDLENFYPFFFIRSVPLVDVLSS